MGRSRADSAIHNLRTAVGLVKRRFLRRSRTSNRHNRGPSAHAAIVRDDEVLPAVSLTSGKSRDAVQMDEVDERNVVTIHMRPGDNALRQRNDALHVKHVRTGEPDADDVAARRVVVPVASRFTKFSDPTRRVGNMMMPSNLGSAPTEVMKLRAARTSTRTAVRRIPAEDNAQGQLTCRSDPGSQITRSNTRVHAHRRGGRTAGLVSFESEQRIHPLRHRESRSSVARASRRVTGNRELAASRRIRLTSSRRTV